MYKIILFACLACLVLLACSDATSQRQNSLLQVGNKTLNVPDRYILPSLNSFVVAEEGELDADVGLVLQIPLSDLGIPMSEGNDSRDSVVSIVTPTDEALLAIRPDALDAWRGDGLYMERIVEADSDLDLYRVFPRSGYPAVWQYFRVAPNEDDSDVIDQWVASCNSPPGSDARDLSVATCRSIVTYESFLRSEISYKAKHVAMLDEMVSGYKRLLRSWEQQ